MRQKALRSFPNRYLFSLYHKVTPSLSIRYILRIILDCKNYTFATSRYSCYFFEEIFSHYEYIAVVFFFHQKKWSMLH